MEKLLSVKKIFIVLILLVNGFLSLTGQTILLEKNVEDSITIPDKGPNSRQFGHFYYSIASFIPGSQNDIDIKYPGSIYHELGWRYKWKMNDVFSCGIATSLSIRDVYDKEKLRLNTLNFEVYQRFNFGKRGNYMGIFLDAGMRGGWNYFNKYIIREKMNTSIQGRLVKTEYIQPDYIRALSYGPVFRLGINNVIFWSYFSLSDVVDQDQYNKDIKGVWIGMQLGLHR